MIIKTDRSIRVLYFTILTRLIYIWVYVPLLYFLFYRYDTVIDENKNIYDKVWDMINPRDARYFINIQENGYVYEK